MNGVFLLPTVDELVAGATQYGVVGNIAYTRHSTGRSDLLEASRGVQQAIEDWAYDTGMPETVLPRALAEVAVMRVMEAGLLAREDLQQLRFEFDRPITDGAARHEARRDLAGV
jgi:hypothetical protein